MKKWEIYLAYVQYEDVPAGKIRPVLIIDEDTAYPINCIKMTNHEARSGEYELVRWEKAGLMKPTTVRMQKRLALDENAFKKKLGDLDPVDIVNIEAML